MSESKLSRSEKYFGDIVSYFILGIFCEIANWLCPANGMAAVAAVAMFTFSAISLMKWLNVRNTNEGNERWRG